jgi:hypothetical protein
VGETENHFIIVTGEAHWPTAMLAATAVAARRRHGAGKPRLEPTRWSFDARNYYCGAINKRGNGCWERNPKGLDVVEVW